MPQRVVNWYHRSSAALFSVAIVVMVALMSAHLWHLYRIQSIRSAASGVADALIEMESEQRGFLLTGKSEYLDDYRLYEKILALRLRLFCRLLPARIENEQACQRLNVLLAAKMSEMDRTVQLARDGQTKQALAIVRTGRGLELTRSIKRELALVHTENGIPQSELTCLVP